MALPAAAAAIDPYLLHARPTAAKPPHHILLQRANGTDRQVNRRMDIS